MQTFVARAEQSGFACEVKAFEGNVAKPAPVRCRGGLLSRVRGIPRVPPFEPDPSPPRLTL